MRGRDPERWGGCRVDWAVNEHWYLWYFPGGGGNECGARTAGWDFKRQGRRWKMARGKGKVARNRVDHQVHSAKPANKVIIFLIHYLRTPISELILAVIPDWAL